jgi:hypothetical protein
MNKRDFLKGMVATAAGLMVPAHVLAESKYEFRHPIAGLKPAGEGAGGKPAPMASDGGVDWYGEVLAKDLIDGIELAKLIGLTAGAAQYSDAGWLHVGLDGTELYIAKRPLRRTISWDSLNAVDAVYGSRILTIKGVDYKIRLLKGANSDPTIRTSGYDVSSARGSEWNRIFYRLTNDTYLDSKNTKASEEPFVRLAEYSESDLILHYQTGRGGSYNWCQETSGSNRVIRGRNGVSYMYWYSPVIASADMGWRPVLEKVG